MPTTLLDTGVIRALLSRDDAHRAEAEAQQVHLETDNVVMLWPILYEALRTKFVKNEESLRDFRRFSTRRNVTLVDDSRYRDAALDIMFRSSLEKQPRRPLSLVDSVLRCFMDDHDNKIDFLLTFNRGDFHDICRSRNIQLL